MYTTDQYEGMIAETVVHRGHNNDLIHAYMARPLGPGPHPGMVLAHHLPGWDNWYKEATRLFAYHGYVTISPDLYCRAGHGNPEDVAATVRGEGGAHDEQVVGDIEGAMAHIRGLPYLNGKVGLFGTCSGGRHSYLAACRLEGVDAIIDCWGGGVVMNQDELTDKRPVAPIDYTKDLKAPILGLFGNEDKAPSPEQVDQQEEALKQHGKDYEFHRYDGAGHGFFYHDRAPYRQEQAVDGWNKVWAFLDKHLS
ncbi:MAG: dienelactone hydrolase family protein [Dehalococcoidia bacterium]|nr:dienelactone hydrolase family protein [Dehalococcoidia bacterium]